MSRIICIFLTLVSLVSVTSQPLSVQAKSDTGQSKFQQNSNHEQRSWQQFVQKQNQFDPKIETQLEPECQGRIRILCKKAVRDRQVWIIANLKKSSSLKGLKQRQSSILNTVRNPQKILQFDYTPAIALLVDQKDLIRLVKNSEILSIQEDVIHKLPSLTMDQANSFMKVKHIRGLGNYRGANQVVAVIDNGVQISHPAFSTPTGKLVYEACFATPEFGTTAICQDGKIGNGAGTTCSGSDACSHGTPIAADIVGNDPSTQFTGMAPDAKLISFNAAKYYDDYGFASTRTRDQMRSLEKLYQIRNNFNIAAVIISAQSDPFSNYCDQYYYPDVPPYEQGLSYPGSQIINMLKSEKIAVVVPTGNYDSSTGISMPSCVKNAVAVSAVNEKDQVITTQNTNGWWGANNSNLTDILAPTDVRTADKSGGYSNSGGTSNAGPMGVGAFALLQEAYQKKNGIKASVDQIESALKQGGTPVKDPRNGVVKPRINLCGALRQLSIPSCPIISGVAFRDTNSSNQFEKNTDSYQNGVGVRLLDANNMPITNHLGIPLKDLTGAKSYPPKSNLSACPAGCYVFSDLENGQYGVEFSINDNKSLVAPDVGLDDVDSDAVLVGSVGRSPVTTLSTDQKKVDIYAGYTKTGSPVDCSPFPDVPSSHVFAAHICNLKDDAVIAGFADGKFYPENKVTRSQMAKFVKNGLFGIDFVDTSCGGFTDVPTGNAFYKEITTLKCKGVVGGFADGKFYPEREVTRGQSMKFIIQGARIAKNDPNLLPIDANTQNFADVSNDHVFYEYIMAGYSNDIVSGFNGNFEPENPTVRGAMSKIIDNTRNMVGM